MSVEKSWRLSQAGLDRLLGLLDPDREAAGRKYEGIRERLIRFFHWRGSLRGEDDADEVIDRVVRRIEQGEPIHNVDAYVHGVARLVLLESLRRREREGRKNRLHLWRSRSASPPAEEPFRRSCLEVCLAALSPAEREMILEYYRGEHRERIQARRALAEQLGLPFAVLRLRAHRIRNRLERCLLGCLGTGSWKRHGGPRPR